VKKRLDRQNLVCSDAEKVYGRALKENLQGAAVIKSFSAEALAMGEVADKNGKLLRQNKKLSAIEAFAGGMGIIIQNVAILTLVGITCYFVLQKWVQIGAVLTIVQVGMGFYGGILGFAGLITHFLGNAGIRKRVFEVLKQPDDPEPARKMRFFDRIVLKDVYFTYPDKDVAALEGVDAVFEKNKKYLILGKSGSGKSTLLKALVKFYNADGGQILIDGKDYADIRERDLSALISIALQTCYIFNRSFKENIDYLQTGDTQKLTEILDFCALREFADKLPEGIRTVIDEEVNQVSGGEKLRINLARALYRDSEVLLLDEVTSALDKNTSNTVESNLLSLKDKTVINVCHKFNDKTLPAYDTIIIMEDGKIVECGNYEELKNSEILNRYRDIENMD
jgi:ABC-type multidrug transport system fused ATPase/permease subunit